MIRDPEGSTIYSRIDPEYFYREEEDISFENLDEDSDGYLYYREFMETPRWFKGRKGRFYILKKFRGEDEGVDRREFESAVEYVRDVKNFDHVIHFYTMRDVNSNGRLESGEIERTVEVSCENRYIDP